MAEQKQPTFRDWSETIAVRAAKNDEFRSAFIADPKATIEKYVKQKLPADLKIQAHVNSEKELHFVLPDVQRTVGTELSDEDLERVAGGETIIFTTLVVTGAVWGATVAGGVASAFTDW